MESALDYGLTEAEFWEMTLAEIDRHIASKKRMQKLEALEKASFDYILADLIGRSISRVYHSTNKMPEISEAYPTLFNTEEIEIQKQQKKDELSALRFKQFAESFNAKHKEASKDK